MAAGTPIFVVHLLGFAAFLWQGLYILTRGDGGRVAQLTAAAALSVAALFGFGALAETVQHSSLDLQVAVDRASWWSAVLPIALWLHLSLRLHPTWSTAPWMRPFVQGAYALAAAFIVLGTATNLFRAYGQHGKVDEAGPLYLLFVLYLFACAGLALLSLSGMRVPSGGEAVEQLSTRLMAGGGASFLIAAGDLALSKLLDTSWDPVAPWILFLLGLGAIAATVGLRSSLLLGTDVRRDFLYNATTVLLLVGPYLVCSALIVGFDDTRHRLLAVVLVALLTASQTLYDKLGAWLDAVFFTRPVREERAAARAYVEALATQPAGPNPELATRKSFDNAVRRALTHLSDPTKLATSPLLNLEVIARGAHSQGLDDNRLNRAAVLKETLLELLAGLMPAKGSGGITGDSYRYYNCLYYPYVLGISRKRAPSVLRQLQERRQRDGTPPTDAERVVNWLLQVDEDTFYKWQRRGSDTIAAALREREQAAGGVVPQEAAEPAALEAAL